MLCALVSLRQKGAPLFGGGARTSRFHHEKEEQMTEKCNHITRVSVHPSVRVGGASLGRCENEALPGMTVCYLHADREAMAYQIRHLWNQIQRTGPGSKEKQHTKNA